MSRGGHNWKGGDTVEGTRSLSVMRLAREGVLGSSRLHSWGWTYGDGSSASIGIRGGRDRITLEYRIRSGQEDWQTVAQPIPISWECCRFGGERPWFVCAVSANGKYCGRRVAKLYGAGRLFACRQCYRLGYRIQRENPMERAHLRLARLHRKLNAEYEGPDWPLPRKPKWMRQGTYARISRQIEDRQEHLEAVFETGLQRIVSRLEKAEAKRR
jgi:hypothetical protein